MSHEALKAIVLNEIAEQPELTPEERIKRAIDLVLALLNVAMERHQ